ncbi:MAG TPA: sulfite exporter TauE/SafE family protein [Candidatus Altiarchaeales archaeon]|nr:sulfite exporter TauE/SafE family protein [Candidatus Altiarchaeales archaeon]
MLEVYLPVANLVVDVFDIIILGIIVGLISGFFGIGGSFIMIPLLNVVFGIPMNVAIGSSLTQIAAMSSSGTVAHQRMGNIDFKLALFLLLGSLSGVSLGSILLNVMKKLPEFEITIKQIYILLLFFVSILMMTEFILSALARGLRVVDMEKQVKDKFVEPLSARIQSIRFMQTEFRKSGIIAPAFIPVLIGLFVGTIAGITGIGGGFIMTPLLIYILGISTVIAIGTDLFQMVFMSSLGSIWHATSGNVDIYLALLMLFGSSIGAQIGAKATGLVSAREIRVLLALIIIVVALGLGINMYVECGIID